MAHLTLSTTIAVVVVDLGFTTLLISQVISVTFYSEREKSDKFCSFTCRKSTTLDQCLYIPSEGSQTQDFYTLKKSIDPGRDSTCYSMLKAFGIGPK